jgi:hypothetical protein
MGLLQLLRLPGLSRWDAESKKRKNDEAPLLRLPAELRTLIYIFAFATERPYHLHRWTRRFDLPGLLRASSQLYHEARPVFFEETKFVLAWQLIIEQLRSTGQSVRQVHKIQKLELQVRVVIEYDIPPDTRREVLNKTIAVSIRRYSPDRLKVRASASELRNEASLILLGRNGRCWATYSFHPCGCDLQAFADDTSRCRPEMSIWDFALVLKEKEMGQWVRLDVPRRMQMCERCGLLCEMAGG